MNSDEFKLLLAQQIVIIKRIEKIEKELFGRSRTAPVSTYASELKKEAEKIIRDL